jgi:hypothetical protein
MSPFTPVGVKASAILDSYLVHIEHTHMNAPFPSTVAGTNSSAADGSKQLTAAPGNTVITGDGLALKNVDKIGALNTNIDSQVVARFLSWQVSREVRRDYHLVTSKLFKRSRDKVFRAQAKSLLVEMVVQGEFLKESALEYPAPPSDLVVPMEVPLRVVSPEAGLLYRAFSEADAPIAALNHASKTDVISKEHMEQLVKPFLDAYKDFKSFVMGQQQLSTKTAAELGAEGGIS